MNEQRVTDLVKGLVGYLVSDIWNGRKEAKRTANDSFIWRGVSLPQHKLTE